MVLEVRKLGDALMESVPAVLYTLFDMARFPWAALVLTKKLGAPEVGGIMLLVQGLFFVPSVVTLYGFSSHLSVLVGEGASLFQLAASRRAADIFSVKLAVMSSVGLLGYGCFPMNVLGEYQEDLLRKFLFTYAIGTLPTLWVIVRQENLISVKQAWPLVGLNLLNLGIMGGLSYALVDSPLKGWGLGLGFSFSSVIALGILEAFLALNSKHKNSLAQFRGNAFANSRDVASALKELKAKGLHSAIIFMASYFGLCSTLLIQLYKNADSQNIANGALNQFFYLMLVPLGQIAQSLNAIFIGHERGKIMDEKKNSPVDFNLSHVKRKLSLNLLVINLAALLWPVLLTASLPFFKVPALKFLTRGEDPTLYQAARSSFDGALPFVIASGILDNARNMLLTAKRTILDHELPKVDGVIQSITGVLTFFVCLGIVLESEPTDLKALWIPLFFINYLVPFLFALGTTAEFLYSLDGRLFDSKDIVELLDPVGGNADPIQQGYRPGPSSSPSPTSPVGGFIEEGVDAEFGLGGGVVGAGVGMGNVARTASVIGVELTNTAGRGGTYPEGYSAAGLVT
jgi:hypothetical protein